MTLSSDQKEEIIRLFEEGTTNLLDITKAVFGDDSLDGRTKEGRAVRFFLSEQNLDYNTTKSVAEEAASLSADQKEFLLNSERIIGMNPLEIARIVFENESIQSLSSYHRVVIDYLKQQRPDLLDDSEIPADGRWVNPKSLRATLRRVNKWTFEDLGDNPEELSTRNRKNIQQLMKYMSSHKLSETINAYKEISDRELFESEFVRATWDKPDLTIDELNLYMTICANYVRIKHIQTRISSLNRLLIEQQDNSAEGGRDLTISLTERLKSTSDELNQTEKRVEALITRLNGDRAKRKEKHMSDNSSFLSLVEEFQQKESRDRYAHIANLQNKAVEEEAERMERVADIKARVFGISRDELL